MSNAILFFVALCIIGLLVGLWMLNRKFEVLARDNAQIRRERDEYKSAWCRDSSKLTAAMRELIALKRQTPGRDRTGRFTKRVTEVCGSE